MEEIGLLALRMSWVRKQRGITFQHLSEKSGLAISYLCQLEKGVRTNPTRQTVCAVAAALGVRPAFLFGEPGPGPAHAPELGRQFRQYVEQLPAVRRNDLTVATFNDRFAAVVGFLVDRYPDLFTRAEIAFQLQMSYANLEGILNNQVDVSHTYLEQLALLAGIPVHFLITGSFEAPPTHEPDELTRQALAHLARIYQVSPERLEELITAAIGSR
ncbi:MAG TPA: helix-turn-helix domain-containing protein [Symbiobacteriaceae bacterium]|jgi:transcriptional regulator with XRE-family HTH domain|nr:helix-turn-helix domain-containing protein [Symbiobacteriaceae bacterium]